MHTEHMLFCAIAVCLIASGLPTFQDCLCLIQLPYRTFLGGRAVMSFVAFAEEVFKAMEETDSLPTVGFRAKLVACSGRPYTCCTCGKLRSKEMASGP